MKLFKWLQAKQASFNRSFFSFINGRYYSCNEIGIPLSSEGLPYASMNFDDCDLYTPTVSTSTFTSFASSVSPFDYFKYCPEKNTVELEEIVVCAYCGNPRKDVTEACKGCGARTIEKGDRNGIQFKV